MLADPTRDFGLWRPEGIWAQGAGPRFKFTFIISFMIMSSIGSNLEYDLFSFGILEILSVFFKKKFYSEVLLCSKFVACLQLLSKFIFTHRRSSSFSDRELESRSQSPRVTRSLVVVNTPRAALELR